MNTRSISTDTFTRGTRGCAMGCLLDLHPVNAHNIVCTCARILGAQHILHAVIGEKASMSNAQLPFTLCIQPDNPAIKQTVGRNNATTLSITTIIPAIHAHTFPRIPRQKIT